MAGLSEMACQVFIYSCFTGQKEKNDNCICGNSFGQGHWQSSQQRYLGECPEVCCLCCWKLLGKNSSWEGAARDLFPYSTLVDVVILSPLNSHNWVFGSENDIIFHGLLVSIVCVLSYLHPGWMITHSVIPEHVLYN